jgi:hypothetical protein
MNQKELQEFLFSIHDDNSFVTGGFEGKTYCPVNCRTCFIKGNLISFQFLSKIPLITEEEFEYGMRFINPGHDIYFGDGSGKLAAEPFCHPNIYTYLEKVCKKFPKTKVMTVTSGILFDTNKIDFINQFKNLEVHLSAWTLNDEIRKFLFPNPQKEKIKTMWKNLLNCQLLLHDTGNLDNMKRDIETFESLKSLNDHLTIARIDHTKHHDSEVCSLSNRSVQNYETSIQYVKENIIGSRFFLTNVDYLKYVYSFPYLKVDISKVDSSVAKSVGDYKIRVLDYLEQNQQYKILFCSAESAYNFWVDRIKMSNTFVKLIRNELFGGSIIVAGLLSLDCIESQIQDIIHKYDKILLPKAMFNRCSQDINDVYLSSFQEKYKQEVVVL